MSGSKWTAAWRGFLRNYVKVLRRNKADWLKKGKGDLPPDKELWDDIILGYQQAHEVPVYDYMARNFVVCDHWFSSVAGPTWPNRMYAMTGGVPAADEDLGLPDWLPGFIKRKVREAPFYKGWAFPPMVAPGPVAVVLARPSDAPRGRLRLSAERGSRDVLHGRKLRLFQPPDIARRHHLPR
jgi:hypothetical protein